MVSEKTVLLKTATSNETDSIPSTATEGKAMVDMTDSIVIQLGFNNGATDGTAKIYGRLSSWAPWVLIDTVSSAEIVEVPAIPQLTAVITALGSSSTEGRVYAHQK